jgi:hypothetical protein
MKKSSILILLLLTITSFKLSAQNFDVAGKVESASGTAVSGASVILKTRPIRFPAIHRAGIFCSM